MICAGNSILPISCTGKSVVNHQEKTAFIWAIADLLRGDYKQSEYGRVILPFTVLRRLDCIQATTKDQVLARAKVLPDTAAPEMREQALKSASGHGFYNTSPYDFPKLLQDPDDLTDNLKAYINAFSTDIRETVGVHFKFFDQVQRLDEADLLFRIVERFANIDLGPARVTNLQMGYVFEELIRRFSEQSNETAGEHFTPREVIRLMVDLLFTEDGDALTQPGVIKTLYDPACGTGGMLSVAEDYLRDMAPDAKLIVFGQELNGESYATCKSDMLIKGQRAENIAQGNTFTTDAHAGRTFDYMLSNPPFGVEWKKVEKTIRDEAGRGFSGRFGAGLPRVSDGSLLFLQHMISKFHDDAPSKLAIVFNGSPLFTGGAGSGESEIRRWIIEQDWLEAIVALPDQLFYNTGISTYIWVLTNRKPIRRKGKVQLIDASAMWVKMRRSLGEKRKEIAEDDIHRVAQVFGDMETSDISKLFDNTDFGFHRITVERPLRLNFTVTAERIVAVEASKSFQNLAKTRKKGAEGQQEVADGERLQGAILSTLRGMEGDALWSNRESFSVALRGAFKSSGVSVPAATMKAVLMALSERDAEADICTDRKGNPEPDAELRDNENVPLKEDIDEYFTREVRPHVPDAWIDHSKTKIGYEVPFNRHFYRYEPPRPLEEIDADLQVLGREIQNLLSEVIT
ncbi:class I SAM-dependent DNA methyltransferase [Alisedimentitalea sp. MJ-SS2]|uniref:type I restriction-modification system subunit M n=1 Tax=Aliisedimentitalea sp. MJ-SS2 TaxID=3049795 RepID=UPI00290E4498|nr:class I SAM-dependent DNA methyltransferase [Alisedimentitalea sp. MJ-SS2]MDU8928312.1 class I SAM-dependent DNA methyltransferase [Alisedimentitalea sp. MJ-SS2]